MLTVPLLVHAHQLISNIKSIIRNQRISVGDSLTLCHSFQPTYILQLHNTIPEIQLWLLVMVGHLKTFSGRGTTAGGLLYS